MTTSQHIRNPEATVWACWGEAGSTDAVAMFAASLRQFGGRMAECPVRVYVSEGEMAMWQPCEARLQRLGVDIRTFSAASDVLALPYAAKPLAAAEAERDAAGRDLLVWFDAWSLVAGDLEPLLLTEGEDLAYRPVEVTNIGCPAGDPPDPFWAQIYEAFRLQPDAAFPMVTTCDRHPVRAYINASMLALRPSLGLMAAWREAFLRLLQQETWRQYFDQVPDRRHYFHQAVLTGVILSRVSRARMREFPHLASYPLHLQSQMPDDVRVDTLSDLLLCRYYDFFENPDWSTLLSTEGALRAFLVGHGIRPYTQTELECHKAGLEMYWRTLALMRGMELIEGDISWVASRPREGIERIFSVSLAEETAERRLDEVVADMKAGRIPDSMIVMPYSSPSNLTELLKDRGFLLDADSGTCMTLNLNKWHADQRAEDGVEVRPVADEEMAGRWAHVVNAGLFEESLLSDEQVQDLWRLPQVRMYLALFHGQPAASSMTIVGGSAASLDFVATLPAYRNNGLGTAVTVAALRDLDGDAVTTVTLRAAQAAVGLYRRVGFRVCCPRIVATYRG